MQTMPRYGTTHYERDKSWKWQLAAGSNRALPLATGVRVDATGIRGSRVVGRVCRPDTLPCFGTWLDRPHGLRLEPPPSLGMCEAGRSDKDRGLSIPSSTLMWTR